MGEKRWEETEERERKHRKREKRGTRFGFGNSMVGRFFFFFFEKMENNELKVMTFIC